MDLFDYIKLQWKVLSTLLMLGVVAVVALGQRSGSEAYQAQTELLVRPAVSELATYASDLDRYTETEMTLLFTEEGLQRAADEVGISPAEAVSSLGYLHVPGSEIVTLVASSTNAQFAVELVNIVATDYLQDTDDRVAGPVKRQSADLTDRINRNAALLTSANETIEGNAEAYRTANPDRSVPPPASLSPSASSDQDILTSRLRKLYDQQAELESNIRTASRSMVLTPAVRAPQMTGWGRTTYLAACIGLLLLLLTAAGVGLALSPKILGAARWNEAVSGGSLRRAIRRQSLTNRRRRQLVRRVVASLDAAGTPGQKTLAVYLPEKTPLLARRTARLLKGLDDAGVIAVEVRSLPDAVSRLQAAEHGTGADAAGRMLVLVDLTQCQVDDASVLCNYPESSQRLMVPVLV